MTAINDFNSIYVWSVADGETRRVTDDMFLDFSPAWDPAGDYLYYLADREYAPQISSIEWNFATDRETFVYALALRGDVEHPLPPESDEVTIGGDEDEGDEDEGEDENGDDGDEPKDPIQIDFDGLGRSGHPHPHRCRQLRGPDCDEGTPALYVRGGAFYYGRGSDVDTSLNIFSFEDREAKTLAEDISGYALSSDGSKVLVEQGGSYKLYDAKPEGGDSGKDVSTSGLEVDRQPTEEWVQIFNEVWRRFRDFFYVENMHGYDWEALRAQYEPWLAHVAHRSDLNHVISEMISELAVGHAYISGGDWQAADRARGRTAWRRVRVG